jgi:hypothetical protein
MGKSMSMVSRRQLMGLLGVAAVAIPARHAWARGAPVARREQQPALPPHLHASCALLAPLSAGSSLGPWVVEGSTPVHAGAVTVAMRDRAGNRFFVDICARDRGPGAPGAPAATERYELFLANEGGGSDPTFEDHGRAAMALAEVIRANENTAGLQGLLTLRQRLLRHAAEVGRAYIPA